MIKKIFALTIICLFIFMSFMPTFSAVNQYSNIVVSNKNAGEKYAVIVGISEYEESRLNLLIPADIADDIYNALYDKGWNKSNMVLLTNQSATKQNIINSLDWLEKVSTENDLVVFTYAGHGTKINDTDEIERFDEAIVPYDADGSVESFISDDELNKEISDITAKGFFIVIDSCFSGGFNDLGKKRSQHLNDDYVNFKENFSSTLKRVKNRVVFMSCMPFATTYSIPTLNDGQIAVSSGISKAIKSGRTSAEEISKFTKKWWLNHPIIRVHFLISILRHISPLFIIKEIYSLILRGSLLIPFPVPHMIDNYADGELIIIDS